MSETKKLQQNEIEEVTNIRKNYFNIQNALGQIFLTRRNTQLQLENLDRNFKDGDKIFTRYNPSIGTEAARRIQSTARASTGFNFTQEQID